MDEPVQPFDWRRLWLGDNLPGTFLLEVAFRSIVMYLLILLTLRITGKRGVKQLSLFELTIILSLGSAAGDPMFYADVPLAHIGIVFGIVIGFYLFFNYLTERSVRIEKWMEGQPIRLVSDGCLDVPALRKENITYQELFGEMRQHHVEHLGQIRQLYLEPTGELSIFFYESGQEIPGLPIFPEIYWNPLHTISQAGNYACCTCGTCQVWAVTAKAVCPVCQGTQWLPACKAPRIS